MERKLEHLNIDKLKAKYQVETNKDPEDDAQTFQNWALLNTLIASHNLLIDMLNRQRVSAPLNKGFNLNKSYLFQYNAIKFAKSFHRFILAYE